ncbi:hypothetical protein Avbf_09007 [Armadillidium vulgare]|nr:hypothetical protein Avbf_09007 [Armadillidium vulgare]
MENFKTKACDSYWSIRIS